MNKIEWAKEQMPVLEILRREYAGKNKLSALKIGACLHITKETAVLLEALKDAGAEVFACGSNPLSTQDDIVKELNDYGIKVFAKRGQSMTEYYSALNNVLDQKPNVIIDDGADLIVLLHNERKDVPIKWAQEETTTGVNRIRAIKNLRFPVFFVNNMMTKYLFDNVYGTGQSTIDGILRATNILLAGKVFVIAGYGNCGRGIAQRARGMGARVVVTEINPVKALQARMDGFEVGNMNDVSSCGDIFITVTGNIQVIRREHIKKMKDGAILGNSGHFDVEIDVGWLKSNKSKKINENLECYFVGQKRIYLLSEGRLVNLTVADGHPSEVMDMSFSIQFLTVLAEKETTPGIYLPPKEIDDIVAREKLKTLGISIEELTKEQKDYLGYN